MKTLRMIACACAVLLAGGVAYADDDLAQEAKEMCAEYAKEDQVEAGELKEYLEQCESDYLESVEEAKNFNVEEVEGMEGEEAEVVEDDAPESGQE
jgi:hypothetical protein